MEQVGWRWDSNPDPHIPAQSLLSVIRDSPLSLGCTHWIPQICLWPLQGGAAGRGDWPPGAAVVTPGSLLGGGLRETWNLGTWSGAPRVSSPLSEADVTRLRKPCHCHSHKEKKESISASGKSRT